MNAKKKLLVSLASFALVLVFAVVSALALRNVKVQSKTYNITFRASAVRATFTMKTTYYKALGVSAVSDTTTDPTVHTTAMEQGDYDFEEIELFNQSITVDNNGAYLTGNTATTFSGAAGDVTTDEDGRTLQGYTVDEINLLGNGQHAGEAATLDSNGFGRTGVLKFEFTATSTSDTAIEYLFTNEFDHANLGVVYFSNRVTDAGTGDSDWMDETTTTFEQETAFANCFTTLGVKKVDCVSDGSLRLEMNSGSGEDQGKVFKVTVYVWVIDPAVDTTYTPGSTSPFTFSAWLADTEQQ